MQELLSGKKASWVSLAHPLAFWLIFCPLRDALMVPFLVDSEEDRSASRVERSIYVHVIRSHMYHCYVSLDKGYGYIA